MKKLKCLMFVAAVACLLVGCRKPVEVSFGKDTQEIEAQGGSFEVEVKSNGEWTIDATPEWLAVSPMSGTGNATLTLTAQPNNTSGSRSGEVKASTKDNSAILTVNQGSGTFLTLSPTSIDCGGAGGEFNVSVTSNINWAVSQLPDWAICTPMDGEGNATVTLTIAPVVDELSTSREADVVFGNGENHMTLHVTQYPDPQFTISATPDLLEMVCGGESKPITVSCDGAWTASATADWVTLDKIQGEGDAEIMVTAAENPNFEPREAWVVLVSSTEMKAIVTVRQEATPDPHFLEVSPQSFSFGKEGGEQTLTIACDTEWKIEMGVDWLSLSETMGTGNATLTLTAAPNNISEPRDVVFAVDSEGLSCRIEVTQEAGDEPVWASFAMDTLFVAYAGGTTAVELTSNTLWSLQASSWVSNLPNYPTQGDAMIYPIFDNNSSETPRYGFIKALHNGQVLAEMVVAQEGKPDLLETDVTEIEVGPEGGVFIIHVNSNQSWSALTDVMWMHCDPTAGFGNGDIKLTVDAMMSTRPRIGYIQLKAASGKLVEITVNQHQ
jgi:hypothetical protein